MEPPSYEHAADAPTAADASTANPALCFFNGCSQPARPGSVKCAFHRKKGTCIGPSCRNQVYARGRCVLHGARKPCTHPDGCDGFARSRGLCSRHSRGGGSHSSTTEEGTSPTPDRPSNVYNKSVAISRHRQTHHPYAASPQHFHHSPKNMLIEVDSKAQSCLDGLLQLNVQRHHDEDTRTSMPLHISPRTLPPLLPSRPAACTFPNQANLPTLPSIRTWFSHAQCIMY